MAEKRNNLELYLKDVFESECKFKIDSQETAFIQTGVESIVLKLVQKVLEDDPIWSLIEEDIELYNSVGGKISKRAGDILKVGSFYEGTKNNFPDEFDIICLFYFCEETKCMDSQLKEHLVRIIARTSQLIRKCAIDFETRADNKDICISSKDGARKIYFDRFCGKSRPAMTMNFIYDNESGERKDINVDVVPTIVIKDKNLRQIVDKYCPLEQFREEILQTGSILMAHDSITFTETEVHVMRDLLSQNHKIVYRLLKYLINGNNEEHGKISKRSDIKLYSSFMIKTMMIFHHYKCAEPDMVEIGQCLVNVLNDMCIHKEASDFPKLLKQKGNYDKDITKRLLLLEELEKMRDQLLEMQKAVEVYDYKNYKKAISITGAFFNVVITTNYLIILRIMKSNSVGSFLSLETYRK
jgi:hypothetical protein